MKANNASDNELLSQYIEGDYTAFERLYARHKGGVFRYLLRQLHHQNVTEDIFQDVWSKVITQAPSFNANSSFSTWLYTIARHKLIDHIRHIKVVDAVIEPSTSAHSVGQGEQVEQGGLAHDKPQESAEQNAMQNALSSPLANTPEAIHEQGQQAHAIDYCLQKLPTHQLDCFLLREESGLATADIAVIVNAGLEATKSRLRSAYGALKICLEKRIDTSGIIARGGKAS